MVRTEEEPPRRSTARAAGPVAGRAAGAAPAVPEVRASSRTAWRVWLAAHHATAGTIWLVYPKKGTPGIPAPDAGDALTYDALVEEALCFGWVDSVPRKRDDGWAMIRVSPRQAGSGWSAVNKARVARLEAAGRMSAAGGAVVEAAKRDGSWAALDASEALEVPDDLARALRANRAARQHFEAFPPGSRKIILQWIGAAKRPETRAQRIATTVVEAAANRRANHYRQPGEK